MFAKKVWGSLTIHLLYFFKYVSSLYCEFGICTDDQECCGANKCCNKGKDIWYYWAAAFLVVVTIMVTACLYMRRFKLRQQSAYSYHRLQTDSNIGIQT